MIDPKGLYADRLREPLPGCRHLAFGPYRGQRRRGRGAGAPGPGGEADPRRGVQAEWQERVTRELGQVHWDETILTLLEDRARERG
ncbi:hypothetical protein [Amaricoccus sp.]|uniref:hypothetical protein n=1 Tax=Amaricoccus sp. TaxID=1872485 RepID=UPI001B6568E2|nr:hypothetical protein [Amaricoccus sp.]MBP7002288.1 hypothetical protein [Amaricoccus sp.]